MFFWFKCSRCVELSGWLSSMCLKNNISFIRMIDTMVLEDTLKEIKSNALSRLGPDFLAAAEKSIEELRRSDIVERFVKVGEMAPDFQASNPKGDLISLTSLVGQGPVIISFYRGRW